MAGLNQSFLSVGATDAGKRIVFSDFRSEGLAGDVGNDRLYGGAGNDTLNGKQGNDYLEGGTGDDTYIYNSGDFLGGDGFDTLLDVDGLGSIQWNGTIASDFDVRKKRINTACLQNHNSDILRYREAA